MARREKPIRIKPGDEDQIPDDAIWLGEVGVQDPTTGVTVGTVPGGSMAITLEQAKAQGLYLPSGWGDDNWRPKRSKSKTQPVSVAVMGDSVTQGYNAGSYQQSWVGLLEAALKASFGDGGTGFLSTVFAPQFNVAADGIRMGTSGAWDAFNQGYGGSALATVEPSAKLTMSGVKGRTLRVYYETGPTLASFEVRANGTLLGTINSNGAAAPQRQAYVIPSSIADGYLVEIVNLAAGGAVIHAIEAYNATGVNIVNFGKSGATSSIISQPSYSGGGVNGYFLQGLAWMDCDLAIIGYGINDRTAALNADTFLNNLAALIGMARAINPADLIFVTWPNGNDSGNYYNYVDRTRRAAEIFGGGHLNLFPEVPPPATRMYATGLYSTGDAVHPNSVGMARFAEIIKAAVMS